jgi:hypothetical protein
MALLTLLDLPPDLLRTVLRFLGTRSLLNAAATCRALHEAADDMPLYPTMTSQTRMRAWLEAPDVAPRVLSLTANFCMWGRCGWVRALKNLRRLVVAFGHVSAPILRHLPATLEHLELHRLDYGDVFGTSHLTRFTRLHTLKLTFTPAWDLVVLDSLDALPLRHLSVRLAPTLVVRAPLTCRRVDLHAMDVLICAHAIHAEDLSLACTESVMPVDVMITPQTAPRIRRLALGCPRRTTVPHLEHMTALESLRVKFDSALLPLRHLAPTLQRLIVDTRFGVAVAGMSCRVPDHVVVTASVGGVPMPQRAVRAMFHPPVPPPVPPPMPLPPPADSPKCEIGGRAAA